MILRTMDRPQFSTLHLPPGIYTKVSSHAFFNPHDGHLGSVSPSRLADGWASTTKIVDAVTRRNGALRSRSSDACPRYRHGASHTGTRRSREKPARGDSQCGPKPVCAVARPRSREVHRRASHPSTGKPRSDSPRSILRQRRRANAAGRRRSFLGQLRHLLEWLRSGWLFLWRFRGGRLRFVRFVRRRV